MGEGSVYVPGGPSLCGGDKEVPACFPRGEPHVDSFIAFALHVTVREYLEFLDAVHATDPEAAWRRAPRTGTGIGPRGGGGQYFDRPGPGARYRIPAVDREGDRWHEDWPAMGVSWEDAAAYVAWRAERDGLPWSLPTELQYEKAARASTDAASPGAMASTRRSARCRTAGPARRTPSRWEPWPGTAPSTVAAARRAAGGAPVPRRCGSYSLSRTSWVSRRPWELMRHCGSQPARNR